MQPITIHDRVFLFEGWSDHAPEPIWTGTIKQFADDNEDFGRSQIATMRKHLSRSGRHLVGGGASHCFTIRLARGEG